MAFYNVTSIAGIETSYHEKDTVEIKGKIEGGEPRITFLLMILLPS